MNNKKIKALKALARQLPPSKQILKASEIVLGADIPEESLATTELEINPKEYYKRNGYRVVHIDHYKRLKKAWNRAKEQGLADYIIWLDINIKRVNKIFEQLDQEQRLEEVDTELVKIAKGGNFWQNLIKFLFSFVSVFGKKKEIA